MDEQERRHEEEVKQRDAAREAELEKVLQGTSEGDMMQLFQSLLNGDENGGDPEALLEKLKSEITNITSMIDSSSDISEEDRSALAQVRQMLDSLPNMDDIQQNSADGANGETTGNNVVSEEELAEALKKFVESTERVNSIASFDKDKESKLPGVSASPNVSTPAADGAANTTNSSSTEATGNIDGDPMSCLTGMFLDVLLDPRLLEPLKLMREAYPCWLSKNESSTEAGDLERYKKQYDLTVTICDILAEGPIDRNDEEKVTRMVSLMHEFSTLAPLPPGLNEISLESMQ
ncbi:peroxin 19 [Trypanosoma theileri]|uniref:Peroxin 19 n=1 Tax=Trypanosoma theileri TaxID=67003 RepID=A0A1X0P5C4_9TRYP|nr:peroxin 19 [Trypanosoma theileri]ORC92137.1 peroxin 19 [Trypanosoma theileri]